MSPPWQGSFVPRETMRCETLTFVARGSVPLTDHSRIRDHSHERPSSPSQPQITGLKRRYADQCTQPAHRLQHGLWLYRKVRHLRRAGHPRAGAAVSRGYRAGLATGAAARQPARSRAGRNASRPEGHGGTGYTARTGEGAQTGCCVGIGCSVSRGVQ